MMKVDAEGGELLLVPPYDPNVADVNRQPRMILDVPIRHSIRD
jgi:hypothetical protein